uniref:DWNN domain-containing protein n=1 Tax=Stegastes partitus TaxID=144197 RepID=A0A3B5AVL2_9TELE
MPHIHYKFSSKLSYDTVVFDGPHITLDELKRRIMGREKLRAADCDLQITNAQNKEEKMQFLRPGHLLRLLHGPAFW